MSAEPLCFVCGEAVQIGTMRSDDINAYRYENIAPHAASGGTMRPVHNRCKPLPTFVSQAMFDQQSARIAELEAELGRALQPRHGHNAPCYYCGTPCNDLAGDPGQWSVPLCHADDPGVVRWHHEACVLERLHAGERAEARVAEVERMLAEMHR